MTARTRKAVGFTGGGVIALLATATAILFIANGGATTPNGLDYAPPIIAACLSYGLPGALLLVRGETVRIGALSMGIGLSFGITGFLTGLAVRGLGADPGSVPAAETLVWFANWTWVPGFCGLPYLLLVLPDGRLPSPRWRPVAIAAAASVPILITSIALSPFQPEFLPRAVGSPDNPVEAEAVGSVLEVIAYALFLVCGLLSVASVIVRFRRAREAEREQLKWVALGGAATAALVALSQAVGGHGDTVAVAAMIPLPLSVAIAVLRHGLWDVDLVINRSLVYGALTIVGVAAYVAVVSLLGGLLDETVAGVVAVGVLAVALQPIHQRLQGRVNQLLYGDRDDPGAALRRLGDRLVGAGEPGSELRLVAETVARALRLPYVEVAVDDGPRAAHGRPAGEPDRLELLYRGERVGDLLASPREQGQGFSGADRRALESIARQVAVSAHAARLADDLRGSRERLVLAREEERRRIRRDLHDELGPTLAGLALVLDGARAQIRVKPEAADATLERTAAMARQAVADVRRLVHDLRPPTLDDLGLVGALEEQALRLSSGGLAVSVHSPDDLGPLPAAVEAAAYRIASEGLANVVRHASADAAEVTLARHDGHLVLRVLDDGKGIDSEARLGVGRRSMRERAEELGGSCTIGDRDGGGTEIRATLPVGAG